MNDNKELEFKDYWRDAHEIKTKIQTELDVTPKEEMEIDEFGITGFPALILVYYISDRVFRIATSNSVMKFTCESWHYNKHKMGGFLEDLDVIKEASIDSMIKSMKLELEKLGKLGREIL